MLNRINSDTDIDLDMLVSKHDGSEAVVFRKTIHVHTPLACRQAKSKQDLCDLHHSAASIHSSRLVDKLADS